jgi:hypothetical protein
MDEGLAGEHAAGVHGHWDAGVGGVCIAQLAELVAAPAVRGAGAVEGAGVPVAGGDLGQCLAGQHAAGVHGHRDIRPFGAAAVAELAFSVITPAVDGASVTDRTRAGHARGDPREALAGQGTTGVHSGHLCGVGGVPVAKLAGAVIPRAVGSTGVIQLAHVLSAHRDLADRHPGQGASVSDSHRDIRVIETICAEHSAEVIAPAVDSSGAVQSAYALISGADLGQGLAR